MQCRKCNEQNPNGRDVCIKCGEELNTNQEQDYCPNCNQPLLYPETPCPFCSDTLEKAADSFCSQCKATLKKGFLLSNVGKLDKLERIVLDIDSSKEFCDRCIREQKRNSLNKLNVLKNKFQNVLKNLPVLSIENPANLTIVKYCGVITSQAVVKTGNIQDLINKVTNNLSKDFESKLSVGEESCFNSLRQKALILGANTIIGCDIEYAELGNSKQTFLIAMMGTAVVVEEFDILTEYEQKVFNALKDYKPKSGLSH